MAFIVTTPEQATHTRANANPVPQQLSSTRGRRMPYADMLIFDRRFVENPVANAAGGGGSTRPASGQVWPRGSR